MTGSSAGLNSTYGITIHHSCSLCGCVSLRCKLQIVCRSRTASTKSIHSKISHHSKVERGTRFGGRQSPPEVTHESSKKFWFQGGRAKAEAAPTGPKTGASCPLGRWAADGKGKLLSLSVRSQWQRVFSTPGLRCPLVVREVAIREAQPRDRATEAIVIGAL